MTADEIVQKIESMNGYEDLDGRRANRLIGLLTYELAKPYLKPEVTEADWKPTTQTELRANSRGDLTFAWTKALGHRGISAGLMAEVMKDWVWLLCPEADYKATKDAPYENYGAPILAMAGQLLDMSVAIDDPEQAKRMAEGLPCWDGCQEGCGT